MLRCAFFGLSLVVLSVLFSGSLYAQDGRQDPAQSKHETIISEIHFYGDAGIAIGEQKQFEEMFKGECDCDDPVKELAERVRDVYQEHGYYKAETQIESHLLSVDDGHPRVSVDLHIEQNLQYRLRRLELTGQKVFSAEQLRTFFAIQSGEVFNVEKIREGLDNLRKHYGDYGYINVTPTPATNVADDQAIVDLSIDVDEGIQFRIGTIEFSGTGARDSSFQERVLKSLKFKSGDVYDARLLEEFFKENRSWLPPDSTPEDDMEIAQSAREHTVDLCFVFK